MSRDDAVLSRWPKTLPQLTPEQQVAREKWMALWHQVLPGRYGAVERFNHGFPASLPIPQGARTLEIGAGLGEHLRWEDLKAQNYTVLEYREELCRHIRTAFPDVVAKTGDIQVRTEWDDHSFDRIVGIHVLEHLPNLPAALDELARLLKPTGVLDIVIPCEGGPAYEFARKISSERLFRKHFGMDYRPIIRAEHINTYPEIVDALRAKGWVVERRSYFPLLVPIWWANLCVGFRLTKVAHGQQG